MSFQHLIIAIACLLFTPNLLAAKIYNESNGIVIMEAENTTSPLGLWQNQQSLANHHGKGYLHFFGNTHEGGKPDSRLEYHFKINHAGSYVIDVRCAKMRIHGKTDLANDFYIRVVGDFGARANRYDIPDNIASVNMLKTDLKYYGGAIDEWQWAGGNDHAANISVGRLDPGGKTNKRQAVYDFKAGQTYTLVVHGRSKDFRVDRIVFRKIGTKADKNGPESQHFSGIAPTPTDSDRIVSAVEFNSESHPNNDKVVSKHANAYLTAVRRDAWVRFEQFDFGNWAGGTLELLAATPHHGGKVEVRTDSATGPVLGVVNIRQTWDWDGWTNFASNMAPVSGKKDLYLVFKGDKDELFNVKQFIFRSGEQVTDRQSPPPINPPAGRLAFVADGNSPDPDDIGATAASLALLKVADLDQRLVHLSHSCDLVKARNISETDEKNRQQLMQTAADGTKKLWGGFNGLTFWNCMTQREAAIADLTKAIDASSASDPLWIIEAGEPDLIGYALSKAKTEKRQHVKLITHHPVNDRSGDYFTFDQILKFGIEVIRIPDQNGATFADIHEGLQRQKSAFAWTQQLGDPRYQWLWQQVDIAEKDRVVGFQKNKSDISDAGMVFYWITGANEYDGYETPSMHDIQDFFMAHDKKLNSPIAQTPKN